jgi:hypothetical protein
MRLSKKGQPLTFSYAYATDIQRLSRLFGQTRKLLTNLQNTIKKQKSIPFSCFQIFFDAFCREGLLLNNAY